MATLCPNQNFALGADPTGECYPSIEDGLVMWYLTPVETDTVSDDPSPPVEVVVTPPVVQVTVPTTGQACSCPFPWMILVAVGIAAFYSGKR